MAETDWKYLQYNVETGQKRTGDGPSGGASSLSDLDDTSISDPSDGQMLGYDETEGKWKNVNAQAGSVTDVTLDNQSVVDRNGVAKLTTPNIDALGKTAISNPADGEMLGYDETAGKWKNVAAPGGNVDDVEVNGVSVVNAQKVAEIKSYKEVTQAQYEALPDTKLNDGILYAIKDGGQAVDGFPPLIYSNEEREIGVWRDGKPLYQKTINIQNPSHDGNWHDIAHGISNPDIFANINGVAYWVVNTTTIAHVPIPSRDETNTVNYGILIRIVGSNLQYAITGYGSVTFSKMFINLQYTKTTDTPGSGTWTTQGTLAHHYSTDEHIIGTWIDGKPLYERTISVTFTSSTDFSGEIKEGIVNISSFVPNAEKIFIDNGKCYYDVSNSSHRGFYAIICEVENKRLNVFTRYARTNATGYFTVQYTKTTD